MSISMVYAGLTYIVPLALLVSVLLVIWARYFPRIFSREQLYSTDFPFPLMGRPDLIMQEWGGVLVIHDLKNRKSSKIYPSDRLQLSLYAVLVSSATKRKVASYGIVRVNVNGDVKKVRVDLEQDYSKILALYERFISRVRFPESAKLTDSAYLCKSCGFKNNGCPGRSTHY